MVVGEDFPFVEHPSRYSDFWDPPQVPSNFLSSLVAPYDPLTPDIARWYDPYPCDTYNTSFGSSETNHPPSCSAIWNTTRSWSNLRSCALAPWTSHSPLPFVLSVLVLLDRSCIIRSFRDRGWNLGCRGRFTSRALPLLYSKSSLRCLYSSMRLMSCLILSGGFFVSDSRSSESSGSLILKVLNHGNSNSKHSCLLDDDHMSQGTESGTKGEQSAFMKELENFFRERSMEFKPPKFYGETLNCLK